MEQQNNKGLIWLMVILIILVAGMLSLFIYKEFFVNKNNAIQNNSTTSTINEIDNTEINSNTNNIEQVKQNFLNDIELAKKGETTDKQQYLLCNYDDGYNRINCQNIQEFNIDKIELYKTVELYKQGNTKYVYYVELSWKCKGEEECFYSEQVDTNNDGLNSTQTYYEVDENNYIVKCLGNTYDYEDSEQ